MSNHLSQIARSWAINAQWRTVKHRYGVKGKALIRVARVPPEECMEQLLAFLSSEEGCKDLYLDGKPLTDEWLPLNAWYERTTATNRVETVEVYHALRHVCDSEADGPYVVHDGCTYKESHTFYWGVANIPELPEDSSGVQHRIESLRRDEESGLYSCVLVKRERVTVDIPEYVTHQDATQVRSESAALGVQGDQAAVDAEAAERIGERVPGVGGVIVDVAKRKNDDCTTDLTVTITEEQALPEAEVVKSEDVFTKIERVTEQNQPAAEALPEQAAGKIVRVTNRKTPGGLFDTTVETTESKPATGAMQAAESIFEKRVTDLQRNQKDGVATGSSASGGVRVEKRVTFNGDQTADVETVTTTEVAVEDTETVVSEDLFSKVTRKTSQNQEKSVPQPTFATKKVIRTTNRKTPGGRFDTTVETTESKPQATVLKQSEDNLFQYQERVENVNQPTEGSDFTPTLLQSGKMMRTIVRRNADGTYNNDSTSIIEHCVTQAVTVEEETALQKMTRSLDKSIYGTKMKVAYAAGFVKRHTASLTPGGCIDEELVVTEAKASSYTVTLAEDPNGTVRKVTTFRNQTKAAADAFLQAAHSGSAAINEFGRYDGSCTTILHQDEGRKIKAKREVDPFEITNTTGDARIVSANGKIYKVTETITYIRGVLHDANVSSSSKASAYAKVDGCLHPDVQYEGGGYYSYYGVTRKHIKWESTTDSEVIEHSWSKS